ncbi:MAG TPA: hypothetical protein VER55_12150 [Ardenticatenaceae bacterium]|nr:hypothetical protein [Ardenticatenaceae bacterium]
MSKKSGRFLWVLIVLLPLAACAAPAGPAPAPTSTPSPAPAATQPAASPAPTATQPTTPAPEAGDEIIAELTRSGGFEGTTDTFVLRGDGTVEVGTESRSAEGGAAAATELLNDLEATGIYAVEPGEYLPKDTCCDRFTYDLTLYRDGESFHYVTIDAAEEAPPALFETIGLILEYANEAQ